jgi:lipoprotein-releasing system permease protein
LNLASFIAWRIAFNKNTSFSRFIIRLAIIATCISVAVMILTFALTSGFQRTISGKVFSFWGHLRVQEFHVNKVTLAEEAPIEKNDTVVRLLKQNPEVTTIQAFATKSAIIKTAESVEGVLFKAVEKDYDFNNLSEFLKSGSWLNFPDSGYSDQVVLSEYIAGQLHVQVNDKILIYFIQPNGAPPRPRKLTISGLYRSGIDEYDKVIAFCDLKLIQRLNDWRPEEIGGYELFLKDYRKMDTVAASIFYQLPEDWNVQTSKELYPNIFDWLNLQNQTIVLVIIVMVIVAILNLVTCLIILVLERIRMIGVLKAVGSPDRSIQGIFLYHGAIITVLGILGGDLAAILLCWLQQRYGFITLPEEAYYISTAAVNLEWWHILVVNAGTFLVCFLTLRIPTLIVKKVQPVRAIQFR